MFEHDFATYPELTNAQLSEFEFISPFVQLKEDFYAVVEKVHDGDTVSLRIPDRDFVFPIRFAEINTKELNDGGDDAADFVKNLLTGQEVYVVLARERVDKWGRLLGTIILHGVSVAETLLGLGLATPYSQRNEGKIINPLDRY